MACPPPPTTTNQCNSIGDHWKPPGFCTANDDESFREAVCVALGAPGEWDYDPSSQPGIASCYYNGNTNNSVGIPGSATCPGYSGGDVVCVRIGYAGDNLQCCINDVAFNSQQPSGTAGASPPACFSDMAKQKTCDPCFRNITWQTPCASGSGKGCRDLMHSYCLGEDLPIGDTSWINRWYDPITLQSGPCTHALKRNLFPHFNTPATLGSVPFPSVGSCTPVDGKLYPVAAGGAAWGSELMRETFKKYASDGLSIGSSPGQPGYNQFQEWLQGICCASPVLCGSSLSQVCSSYTAEELPLNPSIANWCGCYLPDKEYAKYVDLYQVNKECTPMCNRPATIPIVAGDNNPYTCSQTVCIIDDLTLNFAESTAGTVSISQVCNSCSPQSGNATGTCSCVINGNEINVASSTIGNIDIGQSCSSKTCNFDGVDKSCGPAEDNTKLIAIAIIVIVALILLLVLVANWLG